MSDARLKNEALALAKETVKANIRRHGHRISLIDPSVIAIAAKKLAWSKVITDYAVLVITIKDMCRDLEMRDGTVPNHNPELERKYQAYKDRREKVRVRTKDASNTKVKPNV